MNPTTPASIASAALVPTVASETITDASELDEETLRTFVQEVRRLDRGYGWLAGGGYTTAALAGLANLAGILPGGDLVFFGVAGVSMALALASAARGEGAVRELALELGCSPAVAKVLARELRRVDMTTFFGRGDAEKNMVERLDARLRRTEALPARAR